MFRVRNCMPGTLALGLENGSINLQLNGSFDLETACSRAWLSEQLANPHSDLSRLLAVQHLVVVHDSEFQISREPIIVKSGVISKAEKKTPKIIDFTQKKPATIVENLISEPAFDESPVVDKFVEEFEELIKKDTLIEQEPEVILEPIPDEPEVPVEATVALGLDSLLEEMPEAVLENPIEPKSIIDDSWLSVPKAVEGLPKKRRGRKPKNSILVEHND